MTNAPSKQNMANAIRALSMDAVEAAKSGHPGMPMGMADALQSIGQIRANVCLLCGPDNARITHESD